VVDIETGLDVMGNLSVASSRALSMGFDAGLGV
jgi:hypothetical protein